MLDFLLFSLLVLALILIIFGIFVFAFKIIKFSIKVAIIIGILWLLINAIAYFSKII